MAYEKSNCLLLILGLIAALGAGLVFPLFNFIFSGILEMMMDPLQNDGELNTYCLYMAIIAFSAGALTFFYSLCFGVASDRLVYTIRLTMFKKLMKLPVSYYDRPENTAGGINSKLATDAYQIRNMVSGILGVMSLNIATVSASLAFGLYYSWKVTLISLALSPLIAVVGSINMKVIMRFTTKSQ
jgi:ATP-binding cassette, subfamily B (MDR/TAP), member 1